MDWKDIASAVGKAAPVLGTILGGPAGTAVGGLVAAALGTAPTPDAVAAAVASDPAAALKLRKIETTHQQRLQELQLEQVKAELADVAGARARDVAIQQAGHRNARADLMVAMDVVGLIACLVMLVFYRDKIPGEAVGLISTIAGFFGLSLRDAHQFEFGSSRSSQVKDATIRELTR